MEASDAHDDSPAGCCDALSVLFLIRQLGVGGAQTQLMALAGELATRGHRVAVVTFYASDSFTQSAPSRVSLYDLAKKSRWDIASPIVSLIRIVRRFNPQIVHGYMAGANILLTALRPCLGGARVVWGIRASDVEHERYGLFARMLWWLERALSPFPDLIIFNSLAGRRHCLGAGFRPSRSQVIPNGVNTATFRFDPEARRSMRNVWSIPALAPVVGIAARIDPMKGHMTLLKAIPIVARSAPNVRFVCVGDGQAELRAQLEKRAADMGLGERLLWVGAIRDMPAAFSAFDVAVLCSEFGEGFPNVVAEAMACERACVVTDVGDAAMVVDNLGQVVPVRDHQALAAAIVKALSSNHAFGPAARRRIEQEFSLKRLANDTEEALREVRSRMERHRC